MSSVVIRAALLADAQAIAACHVACWLEAYRDIADAKKLAVHTADLEGRTARWRRIIEMADRPRWIAVGPVDDVVGFSAAGVPREDEADRAIELYSLYVRATRHGTGLATELLDLAIGDNPAYLWTYEGNTRAQAFYARHGFARDGTRREQRILGGWEVRLVR